MLKSFCLAALALGVSACNHSKGLHRADSGASDAVPTAQGGIPGDAMPGSPNPADGGSSAEVNLAPAPGVQSVRFTVTYGECGGFCTHAWLISANGASLRSSTSLPDDAHSVEEAIALEPAVAGQILDAAAQAITNPWESRYGCPDCADQGVYRLEVTVNGTIRQTDLDPERHPAFFDPIIEAIRPVMKAHPGPTSICAVASSDCTPGRVSLVLSLSADGTLQPTWYNDFDHSIFLPSCASVTFERVENDVVVWTGHAAECGSEDTARLVGFTDLLSDLALNPEGRPGAYRVTGAYYEGCAWGKPISQAACTNKVSLTSNSIVVTD